MGGAAGGPDLRGRAVVGGLIATGHQRDLFQDAVLTGLTVSCDQDRYLAIVGSLSLARSG